MALIPVAHEFPLFDVQSIHTNIHKYKNLSNEGHCRECVPVKVDRTNLKSLFLL